MLYSTFIGIAFATSAMASLMRHGTVPNAIPIALVVLFPIAVILFNDSPNVLYQILASCGVLILGFIFFAIWDSFGGGTAKLFAASALLIPVSILPKTIVMVLGVWLLSWLIDYLLLKIRYYRFEISHYFSVVSLIGFAALSFMN